MSMISVCSRLWRILGQRKVAREVEKSFQSTGVEVEGAGARRFARSRMRNGRRVVSGSIWLGTRCRLCNYDVFVSAVDIVVGFHGDCTCITD